MCRPPGQRARIPKCLSPTVSKRSPAEQSNFSRYGYLGAPEDSPEMRLGGYQRLSLRALLIWYFLFNIEKREREVISGVVTQEWHPTAPLPIINVPATSKKFYGHDCFITGS